MHAHKKALVIALLAVILWSTVATAFKLSLQDLSFTNLLFYSSVTSSIVLGFILIASRKFEKKYFNSNSILRSALYGFINPFVYYFVLLKAYSLLPAQMAQPLNYLWPVILSLLAVPFLKQKLKPISLFALIISFLGVIVISQQGTWFNFDNTNFLGVFLAAGSSIIWAGYWILNVKDSRPDIIKLFLNFIFGSIYIGLYLLLFDRFQSPISWGGLAAVYVGFFEMGFTFYLWLLALQSAKSASQISNWVFLSPFLSLIFIYFILGESIFITTLPGILLILAGIVVGNLGKKK